MLRRRLTLWPPYGTVRWGSFDRLTPISDVNGFDRGQPIDRYYIERFLAERAAGGDIGGRIVEIGDDRYIRRFAVHPLSVDILDLDRGNPSATIYADLSRPGTLPVDAFDCIICTQTLLLVDDPAGAVSSLHQMLRPSGVALVTVPGISPMFHHPQAAWRDQWRFTSASCTSLFGGVFGAPRVEVEAHGNVLAAAAFLFGLSAEELGPDRLDMRDCRYEMIITVRAEKEAV